MSEQKVKRNQPLGRLVKDGIKKVHIAILDEYLEGKFSFFPYLLMWIRFLWFSLRHFSGPDDYFVNQLYKKSGSEIRTYITLGKMYRLRKIYNAGGDFGKFNDKTRFNMLFQRYILRDWIDADTCSLEAFQAFVGNHPRFICKPKASGGGRGIHIRELDGQVSVEKVLGEIRGCIAEALIEQHPALKKINPFCVNTIRITTIKEDSDVHLISAMFRCGTKDTPVDNWFQGGITAAVDLETGIIFTKGVAKVPIRKEYLKHPVSGVVFTGFQIPYWEETVAMIKSIAGEIDDVRLVGWDVAITPDGPCIVEGNHRSNTTILSVADGIGKYAVVKEIRKQYGRTL